MSFDSCIVTTSGCVVRMRCFFFEFLNGAHYAVCLELKNFYLFCVFCFGGLLFVSCITVGVGADVDVKSWDGCCWGALYGRLCDGNMWGESGRVGCIWSRV